MSKAVRKKRNSYRIVSLVNANSDYFRQTEIENFDDFQIFDLRNRRKFNENKNNRKTNRALILSAFVALLVAMSGCSSSNSNSSNNSAATPNVNRATPHTQVQQTPTPNPTDAFSGIWETKDPRATVSSAATTGYVRWQISPGIQKGEQYTGKITDLSDNNKDVADYILGPKNNITLQFSPSFSSGIPSLGDSRTYEYEASDNGNTITLKADKPIILKRGSSNTDMQKDAEIIADSAKGDWKVDRDVACKIFPAMCSSSSDTYVRFDTPSKYNEGYGGDMLFFDSVPTSPLGKWTYTITAKDKAAFNDGKGTKSGSYKILNDGKILQIDFADDSDPDLYLTR